MSGGQERSDLVVAVDSGGTKTLCALARTDGTVLGVGQGGPANTNFVSRRTALSSLARAAREARAQSGLGGASPLPVRSLYVGAPGVAEGLVREALFSVFAPARLSVDGDTLSSFVGALVERYGVVALTGTGSFARGFARDGRSLTLGGWGMLLGDEGSGYDIGLQALRAVVKAHEERGPATSLTRLVCEAWALPGPRDLIGAVYRRGAVRRRVAGLANLVAQAAREGDAVAQGILRRAGEELGALAGHVVRRLGLGGTGCPVALTGGAASAGGELVASFVAQVRACDESCRVVPPRFTPLGGALLLALEEAGVETGEEMLAQLEAAARQRFPQLRPGTNLPMTTAS